jgi:hypothetical protein
MHTCRDTLQACIQTYRCGTNDTVTTNIQILYQFLGCPWKRNARNSRWEGREQGSKEAGPDQDLCFSEVLGPYSVFAETRLKHFLGGQDFVVVSSCNWTGPYLNAVGFRKEAIDVQDRCPLHKFSIARKLLYHRLYLSWLTHKGLLTREGLHHPDVIVTTQASGEVLVSAQGGSVLTTRAFERALEQLADFVVLDRELQSTTHGSNALGQIVAMEERRLECCTHV